ncbi:MAG: nickel pincer cofactor biosynthesis protein LarC [Oscillochloridaceae bacterium]|nr:nickel pincer cofactor biosynthesis protein LarC [Chloroflexaceae bacterium]MDW8389180.1 nickel pincer cofactor biosynthesis protein LarC [Oscillochloridaceae bacterium]
MKVAYFDCFHGAAGDMLLAALLDAGLEVAALQTALNGLGLDGYTLTVRRALSHGVMGARLEIATREDQPPRDWAQIRALLAAADLPSPAGTWAIGAFARLARVEAAIHGVPVEHVHFHEIGAVDSIVDTVGVCVGLALLGVERVYASPLPLGRGWVPTQHGPLPVPAPATLALLAEAGAPVLPAPPGSDGELVTPTAAALLAELARFTQPPMIVRRVGYGLGRREFPRLNGLRVWIGEAYPDSGAEPAATGGNSSGHPETLYELRCNLDDATGEGVAYAIERLLAAGALDAWAAPLVMKKGRPGLHLACLARAEQVTTLAELMLRETPSLGVRWSPVERQAAARDWVMASTPWGAVRVKRKLLNGAVAGLAPEYEDCAAIARAHNIPLAQVYAAAVRAAETSGLEEGAS